jgi:electron transport complex protein RnfA
MINTFFLIIFTGFSANVLLQFGFGLQDITKLKEHKSKYSLYQSVLLFLSVILIWLIFTFILFPLRLGFMETLLLLPLSILLPALVEKGIVRISSKWKNPLQVRLVSIYNGLVFGAAFFVQRTAESFLDAVIMAAGFSAGYMLSMTIIMEIHKKSSIEAVPKALKGTPLILISLGLLSLVCSTAAIFLQIMNAF